MTKPYAILAVDVGRGTQDILVYTPGSEPENALQLVLPSRTVLLAAALDDLAGRAPRVLLAGPTMGGGPVTAAARRYLAGGGVLLATPTAAATFSDHPEEVAALGVRLVDDAEAGRLVCQGVVELRTGDIDLPALRRGFQAWGIDPPIRHAAVAAQDHGAAPAGESDRRFRMAFLRDRLQADPDLRGQSHLPGELPSRFTRLAGVADSLEGMEKVVLMDTGFAALLGACLDPLASRGRRRLLVNTGNGHSLAAAVEGCRLLALWEHHTRRLTAADVERQLDELLAGRIDDAAVFADGGHGAWVDPGWRAEGWIPEVRAITGPLRRRFAGIGGGFLQAAPFGAMMQAGSFGLLAALFHRHPGLAPDDDAVVAALEEAV